MVTITHQGAVLFSNPIEVVKTRMQVQVRHGIIMHCRMLFPQHPSQPRACQGELMKAGTYEKPYRNLYVGLITVARNEGLRCVHIASHIASSSRLRAAGCRRGS